MDNANQVCVHLTTTNGGEGYDFDFYYWFTDEPGECHFVCSQCVEEVKQGTWVDLRPITRAKWLSIVNSSFVWGWIGTPRLTDTPRPLWVRTRTVELAGWASFDTKAMVSHPTEGSRWLALSQTGVLAWLDFESLSIEPVAHLATTVKHMTISIAPTNDLALVAEDYTDQAYIVDLATSRISLNLSRGSYHPEVTRYPAAFVSHEGRTLLVHAVEWNRLDVSDPYTGQLLTLRDFYAEPDKHYLDYFHGKLHPSPTGEYLATTGWIWTPVGRVRIFSIWRWLSANVWESEDGDSVRYATQHDDWDQGLFWIDEYRFVSYSVGGYEDYVTKGHIVPPTAEVTNALTGEVEQVILGPKQQFLAYDKYLFTASQDGLEAWDVTHGTRVAHFPTLRPQYFHNRAKQFLTLLEDGSWQLAWLIEDAQAE